MSSLLKWSPFRRSRAVGEWNPLRQMDDWDSRMERLLREWPTGLDARESLTVPDWSPKVDITEDKQEYLVHAEVPGVKKEDLKVRIDDGALILSGERRAETEEKGKTFHRMERSYGRFERSFLLPPDVDPAQITSDSKDGLLRVRLPKKTVPSPKSAEVPIE